MSNPPRMVVGGSYDLSVEIRTIELLVKSSDLFTYIHINYLLLFSTYHAILKLHDGKPWSKLTAWSPYT